MRKGDAGHLEELAEVKEDGVDFGKQRDDTVCNVAAAHEVDDEHAGDLKQTHVQRGSVVMASVSDWRTFPDMCLIYG